jgi:hypothetical protein
MDYPLWWVVCSYDLYMYTGDKDYVSGYYANLVAVLDRFYPSVTNNNTNLIQKGVGISGSYGDYAFLPRDGPVTYYNALYVLALKNAATIANSLNHVADAQRWTDRATLVSAAINNRRFDSSVGAYFDGNCGFEPCATHAQDGNSIVVVSGAANLTYAQSALNYLAKTNARPYGNAFYDNDLLQAGFSDRVYPFISYFEIQARYLINSPSTALEEIRRLYGWMTSHDPGITVWEGIGANGSLYEGAYSSQAHGWATGIVPLIVNNVLGVTPTGPGFSTWRIRPIPGDVKWAKGVVPTPEGEIMVAWARDEEEGTFWLSAEVPDGTSGAIEVPAGNDAQVYLDKELLEGSSRLKGEGGYVAVEVDGGNHVVTVGYEE